MQIESSINITEFKFIAPFLWISGVRDHNVPVRFEIVSSNKLVVHLMNKHGRPNSWFLKKIKLSFRAIGGGGVPVAGLIKSDGLEVQFLENRNLETQVLTWLQHHIDEYQRSKGDSPQQSQSQSQQNHGSANKSNSKAVPSNLPAPLPKKKAQMRAIGSTLDMAPKTSGPVRRFPSDKPPVPIESPDKRREVYTQSPLKEPRLSSFGALQQDHPSRSQVGGTSPLPGEKRKRDAKTPSGMEVINKASRLFAHGDENDNNHSGINSRHDSPPQQRREAMNQILESGSLGTKEAKTAKRYVNPAFTKQSSLISQVYGGNNQRPDLKADCQAAVANVIANKQAPNTYSTKPTAERIWPNESGTPQRTATGASNGTFQRHTSIYRQPAPILNTDRSNGMLKRSTNTFSSYGISFKDYDSNKPQYAGGVKNLGNTCYIGSVLQALFNLHPRYNHALHGTLQAMVQRLSTDTENGHKGVLQPLHQLLNLHNQKQSHLISGDSLSGMKSSATFSVQDSFFASVVKLEKQHSLDPFALKMAIARRANKYRDNSQQDAQEFLVDLISELEEEMLRILQPTVSQPPLLLTSNEDKNKDESAGISIATLVAAATTDDLTSVDVMDTDDASEQKELLQAQLSTPSPATITTVPRTEDDTLKKPDAAVVQEAEVDNGIDVMDISEDMTQQATAQDETRRIKQLLQKVLPTTFLFESLMRLQMTCQQCGHQHEPRLEAYRDFAIDLSVQQQQPVGADDSSAVGIAGRSLRSTTTHQRPQYLHHLLRGFLQPELRDLHCPQCAADNSQVRISKQMIDLAPVLVLQLKRFQYCRNLQQFKKVDTEIIIPKVLDLVNCGWQAVAIDQQVETEHAMGGCFKASEECRKLFDQVWSQDKAASPQQWIQAAEHLQKSTMHSPAVQQGEYHLAAIVRHSGASVGLGHYICDVQTVINHQSKWLRYNDSYVVEVDEDVVLGSTTKDATPYLLFYQFIPKVSTSF